MKRYLITALCLIACSALSESRIYELWEAEPAPVGPVETEPRKNGTFPYDQAWEHWSYPIGNGYMGANVFGYTDVERVQLTEKTLFNSGLYGLGGLTSFAEIKLRFGHDAVTNYRRSLNLNEGIATVQYEVDGVTYKREYFISYPDEVMVVRLSADKPASVSFTLAPEIPYLKSLREQDKRTGRVVAKGNRIILSGSLPNENNNYEAQFRVLNEGGQLKAGADSITVSKADSATVVMAAGTNYELSSDVFLLPPHEKLDPKAFPHERLNTILDAAVAKGADALRQRHIGDHGGLFGRAHLQISPKKSLLPTHQLLDEYKNGEKDAYLEELMFHYGRYLLIASSRENTLPAGLQGAWSSYEITPWTGGYWHNVNVQMNYWGACAVNLAETFEAYINYFKAYHPEAQKKAGEFLKEHHPDRVSEEPGGNGWTIGTGATPYKINKPGGHSGPGTGGFTTKLLMDYYDYTLDREYLEEVAYPALLGMSRLFSKTLIEQGDYLLVEPSASPENPVTPEQIEGFPGRLDGKGKHWITVGTTFDQGFVWENHTDVLKVAQTLGEEDPYLVQVRAELPRLDPIIIGDSGQIKEWRQETVYGSIGQDKHRHISHLCPLYPGTLINSSNPQWMGAASKTLDLRGDLTTGWAMAHRMNCRARLKEGDKAHQVYSLFIAEKTVPNLWTLHPPFQIDGNFGVMAGVSEMLLQSHEGAIELLPALPVVWSEGAFDGLVARGNFVVSAQWSDSMLTGAEVIARIGGLCRLKFPSAKNARVLDGTGEPVKTRVVSDDVLEFQMDVGQQVAIQIGKQNEK
ncbi:glycoside hydrolase family 95 protein [Pontiellaceae bacterium B12227]|nr:glycoside hydrolase family 95 protein [Pontiellaceae bacterium B12227]